LGRAVDGETIYLLDTVLPPLFAIQTFGSVKSYAHRRTAHREGALMRAIRSAQLGDIIAELVFTQMLFPSNATPESPEPTA